MVEKIEKPTLSKADNSGSENASENRETAEKAVELKTEKTPESLPEKMETAPQIVVPGESILESKDVLPGFGTYREGDVIRSKVLGLVKNKGTVVTVIPLSGRYNPKVNDYIIGEIKDIALSHWSLNINAPYSAALPLIEGTTEFVPRDAELSRYHNIGDLIFAKVCRVTKSKYVNLTMKDPRTKKLIGGKIVKITPAKVPRLIGRAGSMIRIIKDATQSFIVVGQNGMVWIKSGNEELATELVRFIDENAHVSGLTEKISKLVKKKSGGNTNPETS